MSIQKLPSGLWRAQVYDPASGKNISVSKVLPAEPGTYRTKTEAKGARERARARLGARRDGPGITVAEFRQRWITDPLFARPKESTNIHLAERTKAFSETYGHLQLKDSPEWCDWVIGEWLRGGQRNGTVNALRAMFNDAASPKAGRLTTVNPFSSLGIPKTAGNKHRQPPSELQMANMVKVAWEITPPSFAGWLEFGCLTALRCGELDALRPEAIDHANGEIHVLEQWSVKTRTFTPPKYGPYTVALVDDAADVLRKVPRQAGHDGFVFTTLRGHHYTASSRNHHWNRVRSTVGLPGMTLYLATRHYFGWYAVNILGLDTAVVAEQLGHKDGGRLVEELYGHPDKALRREAIKAAHRARGKVTPLRSSRRKGA